MTDTTNIVDRIAMGLSAACFLVGIVVMGFFEVLAGAPYSPAPLTNEAGDVLATPLLDPTLRTGFVILGLVVLALWGVYKVATPMAEQETTRSEMTAD